MIDLIQSIPGPVFLLIYMMYALVITLITKAYAMNDSSSKLDIPEPTKIDPIELSLLKKGVKGVIVTTTLNLWRKKALSIRQSGKVLLISRAKTSTSKFNKLEKEIYDFFDQEMAYSSMFSRNLVRSIEIHLENNIHKLKTMQLMPDHTTIQHIWFSFWSGIGLLWALGGTKLYLGIMNGRPVGFLVGLLIISSVALYLVVKPRRTHTTALGRKFLRLAEDRFSWAKDPQQTHETTQNDDSLFYAVALFGFMPMMGTGFETMIDDPSLFEKQARFGDYNAGGSHGSSGLSDYSSSGGCSSSGSGCSSGCGGGGCGGGCGGCGG